MTIILTNPAQIKSLFLNIQRQLNNGLKKSSEEIAKRLQREAKIILETRAKVFTGRLANVILVREGSGNTGTLFRYDVEVDTSAAPYAMWVEYGRLAQEGLPYSGTNTRDYSNSSFGGHAYMTDALTSVADMAIIGPIVKKELMESLSKVKI